MADFNPELLIVGRDLALPSLWVGDSIPDLSPESDLQLLSLARIAGDQPWLEGDSPMHYMANAIANWQEPLSDRFVVLMGSHTTLASVSRVVFQHPPLTEYDMTAHVETSVAFMNSFSHRS